jgi:hypothetical protein
MGMWRFFGWAAYLSLTRTWVRGRKERWKGASYGNEEKEGLKMDSVDGIEISSKAKQELAERNCWPEWLGTARIEEL